MRGVLLLLALLTPSIAAAEFMDAERADLKRLIESSMALRSGESYLAESIRCCSMRAAQPALATALERFCT